jgi:hypothetical protein
VIVEPNPFLLIEEGFAGEGPALEVEEFLFVAVALKHYVALLADPLDFGESGLEFENPEIVKRGEGDDEIEGFVLEGIGILGAVEEEVGLELGMDAGEAVLGDVEPDDFESGLEELHFVKEKTFSATDIEDARTGFEAVGVDEGLGNRLPSPGKVFVAAIAETAVAIPVIEFVFLGLEHAGDLVVDHAGEDIAGCGFMEWGDEVAELGHGVRRVKVKLRVEEKSSFFQPLSLSLSFFPSCCAKGTGAGACQLTGKRTGGIDGAVWQKGVQADTGPLELVERREDLNAFAKIGRAGQLRNGFFQKQIGEWFGKNAIGLVGEVDEGFGGIVPSGIFEIHIAEGVIGLAQGIVETEIGW